jgi:prolyl-tRNA synthetase
VIISALGNSPEVVKESEKIYKSLTDKKIDVIYDDRDVRPGEKFADADLLGIPLRVVISEKNIAKGELEIKNRRQKESKYIKPDDLMKIIEKLDKDSS